jgi:hypothetical protein
MIGTAPNLKESIEKVLRNTTPGREILQARSNPVYRRESGQRFGADRAYRLGMLPSPIRERPPIKAV